MSKIVAFPQARIPIGYATVQGQRVPVEIDQEWMRSFTALLDRTGGVSGDTSFIQYINQFFDPPLANPESQEATRAIDELRNELASSRSELQSLRSLIEEQAAALAEARDVSDLRTRLEDLESTLAGLAYPADLRNRIEQIEDRLQ